MFFVYAFDQSLEDYEIKGAFSRKDEADACLATIDSPSKIVIEQSWREAVNVAVRGRLGPIATALEELKIPLDR